jgi:hypothetical protein
VAKERPKVGETKKQAYFMNACSQIHHQQSQMKLIRSSEAQYIHKIEQIAGMQTSNSLCTNTHKVRSYFSSQTILEQETKELLQMSRLHGT